MNWQKLSKKVPPYDTPVLCRGEHEFKDYQDKTHKVPHIFLAFNRCYPPYTCMVRIEDCLPLSLEIEISKLDVPKFTEWVVIE